MCPDPFLTWWQEGGESGRTTVVAADELGEMYVWDVRNAAAPVMRVAPHEPGWVARGVALQGQTALCCGR